MTNYSGEIYKITNKVNGKFYVGMSKDSSSRFKEHLKTANDLISGKDIGYTSHLYRAMLEYGVENFSMEVIDTADTFDELKQKEIYWIDYLSSRDPSIGYNICKGGSCGPGGPKFQGHKHSGETRRKMSQDRMGEKNANYGNRWNQSDELTKNSKLLNGAKHRGKQAYSNIELDKVIIIFPEEAQTYVNDGWVKGNIHAKGRPKKISLNKNIKDIK